MAFCQQHPEDGVCRPQVEFTVTEADRTNALQNPEVAASEARAENDHSLASIKAVFAMAPALIQGIQPHSLETIRHPVWIVAGDADIVAAPTVNAQVAAHLIPGARLDLIQGAGHYAFLSTCTPAGMAEAKLCKLAGPQEEAHRLAISRAEELFSHALLGPAPHAP
jgi:predicted dienelactone hydrolase